MTLDAILSKLSKPKRTGDQCYTALCPAHEDRTPSLSIKQDGDRILLHCHAGCSVDAICKALGITQADLFNEPKRRNAGAGAGDIIATYDYTDMAGKLLFQVCRFSPKGFRQRRPDGAGGWAWNLKGITPALYRLPRVMEAIARAETVFIVEGEKDVHSLEGIGLVATCNAMGAGKWRSHYTGTLKGAHCVILPDNDDPGRQHAETVAHSLFGTAASVKVIELPDLLEKGDLSDWLKAGHTREELLALVETSPEWTPPVESASTPCFALTDLGNAERLIAARGDGLRYHVNRGEWLHWTGALWNGDETGEVNRLAALTARAIPDEADRRHDREEVFKHAVRSESASRLAAMIDLARFRPGVPVTAGMMDSDPWLLNVINGTVDLHTGKLKPHAPADLLSKLAPVAFDMTADCPRWEQFLSEVFQGNDELIEYAGRLAGYLLTGDTREQCAVFLVGKGSNGKSIFLETLRALLGDYAADTPFSTFLEQRDNATNDLASLAGARMVTASEGEAAQTFAESLLKKLTGDEVIKCRFLHKEFFEYRPTFKILFGTNEIPRITSQGYAMKRRIHILPFKQTFYAPEDGKQPIRDIGLREKLKAELPGILAWAIRGCLLWQMVGLQPPDIVRAETAALFQSFDPLADFLESRCVLAGNAEVETGRLWREYLDWCSEQERQPAFKAPHNFTRSLGQRDGIDSLRRHSGRYLLGIGIQAGTE